MYLGYKGDFSEIMKKNIAWQTPAPPWLIDTE